MTNRDRTADHFGDRRATDDIVEAILGRTEATARSILRLVWTLAVIATVGMIAAVAFVSRLDGWKILAITPLLVALASVLVRALDSATRDYRRARDDVNDLQLRVLAARSAAPATPMVPVEAAPAPSHQLAS